MVRPPRVDGADRLDQLVRIRLGEAAGDLVEQQQARIGGERARHFQPLAVEQRQRAGETVGLGGKAGLLQDVAARSSTTSASRLPLAEAGGDQQVLGHRQLLERMRHLVASGRCRQAALLRRHAR